MDRTVYFNPETFSNSNYSGSGDDSFQSTPITSSRASRQNSVYSVDSKVKGGSKTLLNKKISTGAFVPPRYLGTQAIRISQTRGGVSKQRFNSDSNTDAWRHEGGGLTRKILQSAISRVAVPSSKDRDEMEYHYGSVLVLHLQCKNLNSITLGVLDPFFSLKNLYLYKNRIRRIQGLDRLSNLELLDLSRNNVERIDNLDNCTKLKKLCLGFNEIQVVEGLEGLIALEELYVDDQDMPPEQPLIFSPGTMASIADNLLVIDLSSNQLSSLWPIANMHGLEVLVASHNNLDNLDEILEVLQTLSQLRILNLKGNPISTLPTYKTQVIGTVYRLEELDGKEINDTTRACLQKLFLMKKYRARQKAEAEELKKSMIKKEEENRSPDITPGGSILKVGNSSEEFAFSTPTRLSPLPPKPPLPKKRQQQLTTKKSQGSTKSTPTPNQSEGEDSPRTDTFTSTFSSTQEKDMSSNIAIDGSLYDSRARNPLMAHPDFDIEGGGDQMSDMAKIIFRLSNMDDGEEGQKGAVMKHSNYWDPPGSSMPQECRPLSTLEGLDLTMFPKHSASAPVIGSQQANKKVNPGSARPKPATPGGRRSNIIGGNSNDSRNKSASDFGFQQQNRHFYGRTLSPLIELPTPEPSTARDDN